MSAQIELSTIKHVDLRTVWRHEASDFSKWLSEPKNIQLLANTIGIDMQVVKTEANVGGFSADILAEETNTGKKIIIENQLEITNQDHLGKLMTYASGLEANYIIWIFKDIREEHRSAIDWLNEKTNEEVNIFAIKMEVWQIGDSLPAPVFNIICAPNDWQKTYKRDSSKQTLTNNNLMQLDFWTGFAEYITKHKTPFKARKAQPQHWYDVAIGSTKAYISFVISLKDNWIRTDLYIPNNKEFYAQLFACKTDIEHQFGYILEWNELPLSKASRIAIYQRDVDIHDLKNIEDIYKWFIDCGSKFYSIIKKYI